MTTRKHVLQHEWSFYVHYPNFSFDAKKYSQQAYEKLCDFYTAEKFWHCYDWIPAPSDVFSATDTNGRVVRPRVNGRTLEAIGLFKKGPLPEWEEPLNLKGGHWECRKDFDLTVLNRLWHELVLALVGETLEEDRDIVGARVVDKSKTRRTEYRLELWIATADPAITEAILGKAQALLRQHDESLVFVWKNHSDSLNTALSCNAQQLGL